MNFISYTDNLIKTTIRILFWSMIIIGNLWFWFEINLFDYVQPLWLK